MERPDGPVIDRLFPRAGIEGGRVVVHGSSLANGDGGPPRVRFGEVDGRASVATPSRIVVPVPAGATSGPVVVALGRCQSNPAPFAVGARLARDLHPVANPAVDHDGIIYTTFSGSRGQQVPTSIFRITPGGEVIPFVSDLMNPTGLAFGPGGHLYVSSRHDGVVYRVNSVGDAEAYAEGLGVATGLAFDREGILYVGERTGNIYRVGPARRARPFVSLPPSVAAYHLAFGPDGALYVTAPTLANDDPIYRISPAGVVERFVEGLARPQGLAFSGADCYVVACLGSDRGVFRIAPGRRPELVVTGVNLVGLAFAGPDDLIVVSTSAVYRVSVEA
jgi:hypothetical protein